jgi:hypothetical protein
MINQLLIFRFSKNFFLQLGLVRFISITTNSILYANLNSFLIFYIKCYLFYQLWCFQIFTKLTMKNDTKPKQGGGELLPHFPPNPYLEWQEFKTNYHMFLYVPIINLFTRPIPSCLHVQSLCCLHVPLTISLYFGFCVQTLKKTQVFFYQSLWLNFSCKWHLWLNSL